MPAMVQSVELLLDDAAERAVLADWAQLSHAGLDSQSRHRSPSNRPHVTLATVPTLDQRAEDRLATLLRAALPLPAHLGPLAVFGREPVVLVRLVVVTRALLDLHAAVAETVGVPEDSVAAPGRWVPHVTLAHRMPREQLGAALGLLPRSGGGVRLATARRWDGDARRTWSPVP
jgi:2'-5' RNA ligase